MKKPSLPSSRTFGYIAVVGTTLALAILLGWTSLAGQIDDDAYDWMFRLYPPVTAPAHCIILAIDDATFNAMGGVGGYRAMWVKAFEMVKRAQPKAVALDVVLSDPWKDSAEDQRLDRAMQDVPNLVLATHLDNGRWENPLPSSGNRPRQWGTIKPMSFRATASRGRFHSRRARPRNGTGRWRWKLFD